MVIVIMLGKLAMLCVSTKKMKLYPIATVPISQNLSLGENVLIAVNGKLKNGVK